MSAQEARIKEISGELGDAKMMARSYLRMVEERMEAIRRLEAQQPNAAGQLNRLKQEVAHHPSGLVFLPERPPVVASPGGRGGGGGSDQANAAASSPQRPR